jgi:proline iminopeptidase
MRENGGGQEPDLYPPIEPYESGRLEVDRRHSLYWEVSGNPQGRAVVFLHGGPGAGASPEHRRFFDPAHYRIVVFDQRGAGRSRPLAAVEDNSTAHLVADMEALRRHLGIERWQVFGGSWGSTLGLAYAQSHPERVTALVLRGIFLCSQREIDWFLWGMGRFHPEAWRKFIEFLPPAEREDPLGHYHRRLTDADPQVHHPAAQAWSVYEGSCSTLRPNKAALQGFADPTTALGLARLEAHYFRNGGFLEDGALLRDIAQIRHIPTTIVQGRHDVICPIETADELTRAWPEAEYIVVADAGHSAMEPGIRRALVSATDRLRTLTPQPAG